MNRFLGRMIFGAGIAACLFVALLPAQQPPAKQAEDQQAQDLQEFSVWMDSVNQLNGKLGYYLKEKDGPESAKAAQEMQQTFAHVLKFFEARKAEAPAKYAKGAIEGFKKAEELASAGKLPEALQAYYDARANCESCHRDHRVRGPDGNWQIKY